MSSVDSDEESEIKSGQEFVWLDDWSYGGEDTEDGFTGFCDMVVKNLRSNYRERGGVALYTLLNCAGQRLLPEICTHIMQYLSFFEIINLVPELMPSLKNSPMQAMVAMSSLTPEEECQSQNMLRKTCQETLELIIKPWSWQPDASRSRKQWPLRWRTAFMQCEMKPRKMNQDDMLKAVEKRLQEREDMVQSAFAVNGSKRARRCTQRDLNRDVIHASTNDPATPISVNNTTYNFVVRHLRKVR